MTNYVDINLKNIEKNITDIKAINASLGNIFSINLTELEGFPEFGATLNILFEPMDNITIDAYKTVMRSVIKKFEPRIRVDKFEVSMVPEQHSIEIRLSYTILSNYLNGTFITTL